jgi:ribosomal protein S18 acetylase RimI-like enzyme
MPITCAREDDLSVAEFIGVLERSGLAARRPVADRARIKAMLEGASLIVGARDQAGRLVGVARSVTDFSACCYVADLAVDAACQRQGIGRELLRATHAAAGGETVTLLLLSAPAALEYYPKIGLPNLPNCFGIVAPLPRPDPRPDSRQ